MVVGGGLRGVGERQQRLQGGVCGGVGGWGGDAGVGSSALAAPGGYAVWGSGSSAYREVCVCVCVCVCGVWGDAGVGGLAVCESCYSMCLVCAM